MSNINVSIVMTSYNIQCYIERAINSALSQHGVNVEVIVVDDGSSDNTWKILQAIDDPRVNVFQTPNNMGPSGARNFGLEHCTGDWVAIMDGDDEIASHRLERMIQGALRHGRSIVIDDLLICPESGVDKSEMFGFKDEHFVDLPQFIQENMFDKTGFTLGYTKPVMKRSFIEDVQLRYDPDIRIGEDYLFMVEALHHQGSCLVVPHADYLYTIRSNSISRRLKSEDVRDMLDADARLLSKCQLSVEASTVQNRRTLLLERYYHFALMVEALKNMHFSRFLKLCFQSPLSLAYFSDAIKKRLNKARAKS